MLFLSGCEKNPEMFCRDTREVKNFENWTFNNKVSKPIMHVQNGLFFDPERKSIYWINNLFYLTSPLEMHSKPFQNFKPISSFFFDMWWGYVSNWLNKYLLHFDLDRVVQLNQFKTDPYQGRNSHPVFGRIEGATLLLTCPSSFR